MKHNKIFKIIKSLIINLIIFILGIIALIAICTSIQLNVQNKEYANIFGYSIFSTETGSMSPTMETGDLVIVKLGEQELQEQDIITYKKGNSFITHRIIKIDGNSIIAKGDNNNTQDEEITQDMVVGKVVSIINGVGIWKIVLSDMNVIIPIIITAILIAILFFYKNGTKKTRSQMSRAKWNRHQMYKMYKMEPAPNVQMYKMYKMEPAPNAQNAQF